MQPVKWHSKTSCSIHHSTWCTDRYRSSTTVWLTAPVFLTVVKWTQRFRTKQFRQVVQHCLLSFFWLQKKCNMLVRAHILLCSAYYREKHHPHILVTNTNTHCAEKSSHPSYVFIWIVTAWKWASVLTTWIAIKTDRERMMLTEWQHTVHHHTINCFEWSECYHVA